MKKPKLFITGINGKIGSILHAGLAGDYDIWGLDIAGPFSERILEANIADYGRVRAALQQAAPVPYLIHMAADARVQASWESVLHNNIEGTYNVFEAAREVGVRRVIFASSNHVTGAYDGFDPDMFLHNQPDRAGSRLKTQSAPMASTASAKPLAKRWRDTTLPAGASPSSACASAWCWATTGRSATPGSRRAG
jgi:nucleoside-diphosphate-sugar epimerase